MLCCRVMLGFEVRHNLDMIRSSDVGHRFEGAYVVYDGSCQFEELMQSQSVTNVKECTKRRQSYHELIT